MKEMEEMIMVEFDFLTEIDEGVIEKIDDCHFRFSGKKVSLMVSYSWRDEIDATLSPLSGNEISIGLVIDAIATYQGKYVEPTGDVLTVPYARKRAAELAGFLRNYYRVLEKNNEITNELEKLRFWHVGSWVEEWGKGIKMTEDAIAENKLIVPRIVELLK